MVLTSLQASRSSHYRGAFIAPLPTWKNNILGLKSLLQHWMASKFVHSGKNLLLGPREQRNEYYYVNAWKSIHMIRTFSMPSSKRAVSIVGQLTVLVLDLLFTGTYFSMILYVLHKET
jgi:hypothetical protein